MKKGSVRFSERGIYFFLHPQFKRRPQAEEIMALITTLQFSRFTLVVNFNVQSRRILK